MWLEYGVNSDLAEIRFAGRELVTINDVTSGLTNLVCPFCDSNLTAKKGKIKQHHFAHRILRFTLYFLEIKADGKTLHKIGVTSRTMKDRLPEIERDLKQHYKEIGIYVLGTWKHRGNVELYFKHRYREFNYPIGKLTEYYLFQDIAPVKDDLYSMKQKVLQDEELEVWGKERLISIF